MYWYKAVNPNCSSDCVTCLPPWKNFSRGFNFLTCRIRQVEPNGLSGSFLFQGGMSLRVLGGHRNKEALPLPGAQFSYLVTLGLYIYKNAYILIHCFEILLHCWLVRCIHGAISHLLLWSLVYKMRLPWTYILNEELSFPALLAPSLWRNSNYLLKHLL